MSKTNTFGESIKQRRLAANLTLTALAESIGIDRTHIARIEAGEREPTLSIAVSLAQAVGSDVYALGAKPYNSDAKKTRAKKARRRKR